MSSAEIIPDNRIPAPGWKGGFAASNPKFAYPDPDLSSLPLLGNMDNIDKLERQVHVLWPEFSWESIPGKPESRCYEMFAPDISRAGYTDEGRIYSIICPQQGSYSKLFGSVNIEVTVTGQRGWMNESVPNPFVDVTAGDMTVSGQIWFAPSARDTFAFKLFKTIFEAEGLPFPLDKAHAIQLNLHRMGNPAEPIIAVRSGVSDRFENPEFALHADEAWGVAHLEVQIGPIQQAQSGLVNDFNAMILAIVNLASGNILKQGNTLTWNVWFDAPSKVDQVEWRNHANFWRTSIDVGHGSPEGQPTRPKYFDGQPYTVAGGLLQQEWAMIKACLEKHRGISLPDVPRPEWLSLAARRGLV